MEDETHAGGQDASEGAEETIARQAQEIAELQRELGAERLAEDLRRAFTLASVAGVIAGTVTPSHLLERIVETAAYVISARAASLFLIDREQRDLVFEVAIGPAAEAVEKFRVPLGHGVAGIVALTGQSMAVSDVQSDPRHASDISQSVGYLPESILCVPLVHNDEIIGVLELLDKEGAPSFGPADIELLGLFANQAAIAIQQARTQRDLVRLIGEVLASFDGASGEVGGTLAARARAFAADMQADNAYRQTVEIAHLVEEIGRHGEAERTAVRAVLRGFANYLRSRPDRSTGLGDFR